MAIDTAAKRKSCIGLALFFLRTGVIPDGTNLSADQRLHTDGMYVLAAAVPGTVEEEVVGFSVYVQRSESWTQYVDRGAAATQYIDRSRSVQVER